MKKKWLWFWIPLIAVILAVILGVSYAPKDSAVVVPATPVTEASKFGEGNVVVEKSFYVKDGQLVGEIYFSPQTIDLSKYVIVNTAEMDVSELANIDIDKIYVYIKAIIDYEASAGDPGRLDKALDEMHYVIQSRDGKFVMLRLRRDPNLGTCKVLGVAMNVQETIVAIQDVDGNEKLMTYNGGVNKSLQLNHVSFYTGKLSGMFIDPETNYAASVQDQKIVIYAPDYSRVAETIPCEDINKLETELRGLAVP